MPVFGRSKLEFSLKRENIILGLQSFLRFSVQRVACGVCWTMTHNHRPQQLPGFVVLGAHTRVTVPTACLEAQMTWNFVRELGVLPNPNAHSN